MLLKFGMVLGIVASVFLVTIWSVQNHRQPRPDKIRLVDDLTRPPDAREVTAADFPLNQVTADRILRMLVDSNVISTEEIRKLPYVTVIQVGGASGDYQACLSERRPQVFAAGPGSTDVEFVWTVPSEFDKAAACVALNDQSPSARRLPPLGQSSHKGVAVAFMTFSPQQLAEMFPQR